MLTWLVFITRLILAAVFAVAGVAKLADRTGTQRAVADFGAPERFAAVLGLLLPIVELLVAFLLLPASTAVTGALGALVLLVLFSGAIGWNLVRGRTPDCHCFGQLHSEPAGRRTLVRNGALTVLALLAVAGSLAEAPVSAIAWIGDLEGAEVLALVVGVCAAVLLGVGCVAFLTLMRSYGQVLTRLGTVEAALAAAGVDLDVGIELSEIGLEPGTPAPAFSATSIAGETVTLETLTGKGSPTLLLFTSPHCLQCAEFLPRAASWQREYADRLSVVLASDGSLDELLSEAAEFELERILVDDQHDLYRAFVANGVPSGVLISPEGTIASWVASGSAQVERLVESVVLDAAEQIAMLEVGADVPPLELPSLDGERVSLGTLRGRDTLYLFWNPSCGFCRGMHEDLLAREETAESSGPRLVIISSGGAEETRREGFGSLVLLDRELAASSTFGASGTPMGVLVDADGRIASEVVAGAEALLDLARSNRR